MADELRARVQKRQAAKDQIATVAAVHDEGRKLSAAIAALAAVSYKTHRDLQKTLKKVDSRLARIESDLGEFSKKSTSSADKIVAGVVEMRREIDELPTLDELEKEIRKESEKLAVTVRDEWGKDRIAASHAALSPPKSGSKFAKRPSKQALRELSGDFSSGENLVVG